MSWYDPDLTRRQFLEAAALSGFMTVLPRLGQAAPLMIPVLMYHDISIEFQDDTTVSPTSFAAQMELLSSMGYQAIPLRDALRNQNEKVVVITFDDGYASFCDYVFPLLKQYSYHATINVIGEFVGRPLDAYGNRPMLGWDEYRELSASGLVSIGCHSMMLHHWALRGAQGVDANELKRDLGLFQQTLKKELGAQTDILAWPYGLYYKEQIAAVMEEGFSYFLTTAESAWNVNQGSLEIPRLKINQDRKLASFLQYMGVNTNNR